MKNRLVIAITLLAGIASAQIKNQKKETAKIYGNCAMCENTIETAGNLKHRALVDWDKGTKIAVITYDTLRTSRDAVLKRIALAGYDSDVFLAPEGAYTNLPECCRYDREAKPIVKTRELAMGTTHPDHAKLSLDTEETFTGQPLDAVYNSYFALKDALVNTNGEAASASAKVLVAAIGKVNMADLPPDVHNAWMQVLDDLKQSAQEIADTTDVARQRDQLNTLSTAIYAVMRISKPGNTIYYQFCPMANSGKGANWLSRDETIANPYYGSQMLRCGSTVETLSH